MNKTERALEAAQNLLDVIDEYPEQLVPINRESATVSALRKSLAALSQSEAPADQPTPGVNQEDPGVSSGGKGWTEDEWERFEAFCTRDAEETHHKHPDGFAIWQAAKRDALTQASQERNLAGETPTEHAHRWATELAVSMGRKFYPEVAQWKPLPDLLGVITQIDNMTAGLVRAPQERAAVMGEVLRRLVKFIVNNKPRYHKDHACAECEGTMIVPGFRCGYHEALALSLAQSSEGKKP